MVDEVSNISEQIECMQLIIRNKTLKFAHFLMLFFSNIVAIWEILCQDAVLTAGMIDQMLDMLQRQLPYEEKKDGERITKTSTQTTLAVSA